jgi:hypothetical protein
MPVTLPFPEVTHPSWSVLISGKANQGENVWETARREAWEEIGLPENIPPPFTVEHLCRLRPHLSRHQLLVTPVVAYLSSTLPKTHDPSKLVPSLDTKEVSSLFNLPFEQFLQTSGKEGAQWIFHDFFATVTALVKPEALGAGEDPSPVPTKLFTQIWGLTARILVDACIVGYGRMPEFKHTVDLWDDNKIEAMIKYDQKLGSIVGRKDGHPKREFKL